MKIIKDPVHGYVEVDEPMRRLLDAPPLQRLRHVRQLGFSYLVYPGANHTRFEHSLGTMHLAAMMCRQLDLPADECELVTAAALLHDIGHGPYSHAIEPFMREFGGIGHAEHGSRQVAGGSMRPFVEGIGLDPSTVAACLSGSHALSSIIQGDLDVDRMDYLLRDAHYTGVPYGTVDAHRLIQSSVLAGGGIVIDEGGTAAAESLLIARTLMRPSVYFHHVSRIAATMLRFALYEHVRCAGDEQIGPLLEMDDAEFLHELLGSPCAETRDMAERLYSRRLYKRALYAGVDQVNAAALQRDTSIAAGRAFAREIASVAGVSEHAVLVDIPPLPTEMSMNVQVRNQHAILGLEELSPLVNTLNETRRQQWRLGVYAMPADRERVEDAAIEVFHVKRATKQHKLPVG